MTRFRIDTLETKEPETLDWIDTQVRDGDVVFDVGGNVGIYTLYAAFRHPRAFLVAFEPEYANLHLLRDNVVANGLSHRVRLYSIALSDRTGVSLLHVQDLMPGAALHTESATRLTRTESGERVVLSEGTWAMTLDDFCGQADLYPNALKIDVDGGEGRVLAGAAATLARPALRTVIVEGGGCGLSPEVRRLLERSGLRRIELPQPSEAGNEVWAR
jgi:FkbM family methyltransferase